jgi:predicted secreted protein
MKKAVVRIGIVLGLLLFATSVYAAHTITLNSPAVVNGKQLPAGQYDVKVSPSGDVSFRQNNSDVATAKAKFEDRESKARRNIVVTKPNASGVSSITEIQFEGKKQALVFGDSSQMSENGRGQQ